VGGAPYFLIESFHQCYGPASSLRAYRAPGRVNLIGEHTDYNLGYVLPMAIGLDCLALIAPADESRLSVFSGNLGERRRWKLGDIPAATPAGDWSDYVLGVARELVRAGFELEPSNLYVWSYVPAGAGLSSSAALEVSAARALLGPRGMDPRELARLCRRAENDFAGVPCGVMDQFVSIFGREGAAIRIDCGSLEHVVVPLPEEAEFIAVNTMVRHEHGSSAYRERVAECAAAAAAIRTMLPGAGSLRDVSAEALAAAKPLMPETLWKRARHVVSENRRVLEFEAASRAGDLKAMGELLAASHRSLQTAYEVSCPELDFLVDHAMTLPGVYGARMTGGGFGGCTLNLVDPDYALAFQAMIADAYEKQFGKTPEIYPCRPSAGAGELAVP